MREGDTEAPQGPWHGAVEVGFKVVDLQVLGVPGGGGWKVPQVCGAGFGHWDQGCASYLGVPGPSPPEQGPKSSEGTRKMQRPTGTRQVMLCQFVHSSFWYPKSVFPRGRDPNGH